jgi:hypothetical protein
MDEEKKCWKNPTEDQIKNRQNKGEAFSIALSNFLLEQEENGTHPEDICMTLIANARIQACFYHTCYFHMLGMLTQLVNEDLAEIWEDIQNRLKKEGS